MQGEPMYNQIAEGNREFLFANRSPLSMVIPVSFSKNRQNIDGGLLRFGGIMREKISGVYEIVNTENGHRYIGSSANIPKRWNEHKRNLRNGKHHSTYLQRAWNKYGESDFQFSVLCEIESKEARLAAEQEYIDNLKPVYNICKIARSRAGVKCSDDTRRKMSIADKGRIVSPETRQKISERNKGKSSRPASYRPSERTIQKLSKSLMAYWSKANSPCSKAVDQFSKLGEFVKRYPSLAEAGRAVGVAFSSISACCSENPRHKTAGGFVWRYADKE